MKRIVLFLLLFLIINLSGCTISSVNNDGFNTKSPTFIGSLTIIQTTPTFNNTKILPNSHVQVNCLPILSAVPANIVPDGSLILKNELKPVNVLRNMRTGEEKILRPTPTAALLNLAISPNRMWMSYEDYDLKSIIIVKADGTLLKIIPEQSTWELIGWLNDEQLAIRLTVYVPTNDAHPEPNMFDMTVVPSILFFNPFSGEQRILNPNFPDLDPPVNIPWWNGWSGVVYDPYLRYAVYLGSHGDTMWDIKKSQEMAHAHLDSSSLPIWSPAGDKVVIASSVFGNERSSEIFLMDAKGRVTQLTNISIDNPNNSISGLSWSPNSKYVAFWLSVWNDETISSTDKVEKRLAILNSEDGSVINYCIPGSSSNLNGGNDSLSLAPLWSPDSSQVVVENIRSNDSNRLILVDIKHNLAIQISEHEKPLGWLTAIP